MTPRTFLVHGLIAGLVAGIAAFLIAYVVAEPQIDTAIALEEAASAAPAEHTHAEGTPAHSHDDEEAGHSHGDEAEVSRGTQATWGLATGTILFGTVIGGATALAAAFALGRLGSLGARGSTATITLVGFVATALVPFLKYPSTPPAVGSGGTIGERTGLYFAFWVISLVAAVVAVVAGRRLHERIGGLNAVVVAALGYLVVLLAVGSALPTVNEVGEFPADTLWYFRRESLVTLAGLWGVLGVVLTGFVGREVDKALADQRRREAAAAL